MLIFDLAVFAPTFSFKKIMSCCDVFLSYRSFVLTLLAFLFSLGMCSVAYASTITSAHDFPSSLQTSQSANHTVTFTTPTGVVEGQTVVLTFSSAFGTATITEDDVDVTDDSVDLTTASDCTGSEQMSVVMSADVLTLTVCAGDGGAITAGSVVVIEIGTHASASGTGSNQITNPSTGGVYFLAVSGTFSDSGTMVYPISTGSDQVSVSAAVSVTGGDGGSGTPPVADTTAPTISSVIVSGITSSQATVSWSTSEMATSAVDYGTTTSFGQTVSSPYTYTTSHSMTLTGLSEGQTYYVRVRSSDVSGNQATSSSQTFTTLDVTAPTLTDIEVTDVTTTSARVTWTTSESATSILSYGTTTSYGTTSTDSSFVTFHSLVLSGLSEETTYHFFVGSADVSGNSAFSSDQTFTTDTDDPPANVSGFTVTEGDTQLLLSWINPSDADLAGVRGLLCTDEYPTSYTDADCTIIFDSLLTSFITSGLINDTQYYLGVFAYDTAGQFASGALGTGMPTAPEEELPSDEEVPEEEPGEEETPGEGETPSDEESPTDQTPGEEEQPPVEEGGEQPPSDITGPAWTCGDGLCVGEETPALCPEDCAEDVLLQPGETTEPSQEERGDMRFLVAEDTLALSMTDSGVVEILPGTLLHLVFSSDRFEEGASALFTLGDQTYLLSSSETQEGDVLFEARITVPVVSGTFPLSVVVTFPDHTAERWTYTIEIEGYGYAFEIKEGKETILGNTVFTLYAEDGSVWDGSPFAQWNPFSSDATGLYAWYVPNGSYVVRVQHEGYDAAQSAWIGVTNHIVAVPLEMSSRAVAPLITGEGIFSGGAEFLEEVLPALEQAQQVIAELPIVEEAVEVSVPVLAVSAGASVVVLGSAFHLFPFFQYLFTSPLLLFGRRKRKKYGVVYHAYRKTPVDLAVVRLYRLTGKAPDGTRTGKLVKSCVTNKEGKYAFFASPGTYYLTVAKAGHTFPSSYLSGEKSDGDFLDVYHGEEVEVTGDHALLTPNIPLDPREGTKEHLPSHLILRSRLRFVQQILAFGGVVFSFGVLAIAPSLMAAGMFLIQLGVYGLARRLALSHKPLKWGMVYDKTTGRPLANTVARIFEQKYHRLVETQVTDSKGRYSFLLGPNQYAARFEHEGFDPVEVKPIDFTSEKESKVFSIDVSLVSQEENKK
jgi:hypothetical protein